MRMMREEKGILSLKEFPGYFSKHDTFSDFIEDWLTYKDFQNT